MVNLNELSFIDRHGMNVLVKNYINILNNSGKFIICGMDKLLDYNGGLLKNLYQVSNEKKAFEVINI